MNFNTARLQANIAARAARLWEDGYTLTRKAEDTLVITSNEGTNYEIDTFWETCSCPCFKNNDTCKHWIGWKNLEKIQAEYEEHLLSQAPTEDEEFGRTWYECRAAALAR
ncbi:MAG: hypothetical protein NT023_22270 [Armatimonadetes bacterium]|nr:hypothetical protein [Armatimonadota bacterium]